MRRPHLAAHDEVSWGRWLLLAALTVLVTLALGAFDVPSPALFAGLVVAAGLANLLATTRESFRRYRAPVLLAGAGVLMVAAADASGMSKAEVERIWLPFVPWLLISCALLPERWRRWGVVAQIVLALVVQHLLFTGW